MPPSLRSTRRRVAELEEETGRLRAEVALAGAALEGAHRETAAARLELEALRPMLEAVHANLAEHVADDRRHLPRVVPR